MPPAARIGDMHTCPMVNPGTPPPPHVGGPITTGAPTVIIGGSPAARVTDMATCAGPPDTIAMGSPTVIICGQMAARIGDNTVHGGVIVAGCPTVLIGGGGGGGGGVAAPAGPGLNVQQIGAASSKTGDIDPVLRKLLEYSPDIYRVGKAAFWAARTGQAVFKAAGLAAIRDILKPTVAGALVGVAIDGAIDGAESAWRNREMLSSGDPGKVANFAGRVMYSGVRGAVSSAVSTASAAATGAAIGAVIGSVVPGIGTVAGAIAGAGIGMLVGSFIPQFQALGDNVAQAMDHAVGGSQEEAEANVGQGLENAAKAVSEGFSKLGNSIESFFG